MWQKMYILDIVDPNPLNCARYNAPPLCFLLKSWKSLCFKHGNMTQIVICVISKGANNKKDLEIST